MNTTRRAFFTGSAAMAVAAAKVRARKEIFALTAALRRHRPDVWKGLRVIATAEQLGHRAARRIHGRYTLTLDDLRAGRSFPVVRRLFAS